MSNPKEKLQPEDRVITSLENVRMKLVAMITTIDAEIKYLERAKNIRIDSRYERR